MLNFGGVLPKIFQQPAPVLDGLDLEDDFPLLGMSGPDRSYMNYNFRKWQMDQYHIQHPKDPCREYLPTFPLECGHFSPNVGKYSIHGFYST